MIDDKSCRPRARIGLLATSALIATASFAVLAAAPALAQDPPGAVVQAVPPPAVDKLNVAMRKLSSDPTNLDALIEAGNAALVLHDPGSAASFFARAAKVAPKDPRVALGYGRVEFARRNPVDALRLFNDAERGGADMGAAEIERALAYDLVGDNSAAQAIYTRLLREKDDPETRQRLAISQAISGKRAEFEKTLLPLLQRNDRSAFRTRAFGLAILGKTEEAVKIADAMMSSDMALKMAPYLRYMPRLTRAQQAAAADMGMFPAESQIGRDRPEIAAYAATLKSSRRSADAALEPTGTPLGPRADRSSGKLAVAKPETERRSNPSVSTELPPIPEAASRAEQPLNSAAQRRADMRGTTQSRELARNSLPLPAARPTPTLAPSAAPTPTYQRPTPPPALPQKTQESVAQAFADLGPAPKKAVLKRSNVVDMAKFKPPLEESAAEKAAAKKAAAEKAAKEKAEREKKAKEKANPARYWVQVATGKSVKALGFDWRRIEKKSNGILDNKGPYVTPWVEANRLLAGPYPSQKAADRVIEKLKAKGIDCFAFTSDAGQVIDKID